VGGILGGGIGDGFGGGGEGRLGSQRGSFSGSNAGEVAPHFPVQIEGLAHQGMGLGRPDNLHERVVFVSNVSEQYITEQSRYRQAEDGGVPV
jgi:hypothetical protein